MLPLAIPPSVEVFYNIICMGCMWHALQVMSFVFVTWVHAVVAVPVSML